MKTFLLPVDDSIHSRHTVQYLLKMSPVMKDFMYHFFYVQPSISDYIKEDSRTNLHAMKTLNILMKKNKYMGNEILNRHKMQLMENHVPEDRIFLSNRQRMEGVAWSIIHQAWNESIDAIIMGRHGFSKIKGIFIGSTTKNVIERNTDYPVWVIDGEILSRNILLAVDGSTNSVKALGHLCDILRPNPDVRLTLFHVQSSWRECCDIDFAATLNPEDVESASIIIEKANRRCVANFMDHAREQLKELDISDDRMDTKTQPSKRNIGKAIIEEFKNGDYGTLVVGKRGMNRGFFIGSVSDYLVNHFENGALWIVP